MLSSILTVLKGQTLWALPRAFKGVCAGGSSLGAGDLWRSFVKAVRPSPFLPWLQLLGGAHGPLRS